MKKIVGIILGFSIILFSCNKQPLGLRGMKAEDFFNDKHVQKLAIAAQKGDIDKINELYEAGVDINTQGKDGLTPLFWCMLAKNKEGFRRLLELGADPNLQFSTGDSVVNTAAIAEDSEYLEWVLEHGGNPDLLNEETGRTPVFDAISHIRPENLELLIQAGANLNARDETGDTPLICAGYINRYDLVHILLSRGADYTISNIWGSTVVFPIENNNIDPKSDGFQWQTKVIDFLRSKGVAINDRYAEYR